MATDTLHPFMRDDVRGETSMWGDAPEVTIVLTTSPCRSHPSTMLIEETVSSIARHAGASPATETRLLVVCDGVKVRAKSKFRSGQVDEDGAARYEAYLDRLAWLARDETGPLRGGDSSTGGASRIRTRVKTRRDARHDALCARRAARSSVHA